MPAGTGSLGYAAGDRAVEVGAAAEADGVGAPNVAAAVTFGVGDTVTALDGEGVQPAAKANARPASRPPGQWVPDDI